MTVKEFFDYAKSQGAENAEILINYDCCDDWYCLENEEIDKKDIFINDDGIFIQL